MRNLNEITINLFSIIFMAVAIVLASLHLVSWWVILLIVLADIKLEFKFPI